MKTTKVLALEDVHGGYGSRPVLNGVSFTIHAGETAVLAGPNGCGKSTLLKAVVGGLPLSSGKVVFEEAAMCGWSTERRINAGIGYLRQNENIFPGLTVRENLELSGWTLVTTERIVAQERILVLFEFLKDRLNDRAGLLSGGQRQALAIAMVLMHRRKLYLLDEPTAGLSPKAAGDIVERIRRFAESMPDSAVLMVEHRLELLAWVDFAVVLNQGQVVVNTQQSGGFIDSEWLSSHYF